MNNKFLIVLAFIGIMFLTSVYAAGTGGGTEIIIDPPTEEENKYEIDELGNVLLTSNRQEITLDYQSPKVMYLKEPNGNIIDWNTKLKFKNLFFYNKFKYENKIYTKYTIQNKFYEGLNFYMNNGNQEGHGPMSNNGIVIIDGDYQR